VLLVVMFKNCSRGSYVFLVNFHFHLIIVLNFVMLDD
jgi:hypothetical protein